MPCKPVLSVRLGRFRIGAALFLSAVLVPLALNPASAKNESKHSGAVPLLVAPPLDPTLRGAPLDPAWPKRVYVMTDSVMLGAKQNFIKSMPDWQVTYAGRPALMIHKATEEVRQQRSLGPVAVVALGYNTLWERDRQNFTRWSTRFDKSVEDMLSALKERGARKIVWVMLRELTPELVTTGGVSMSQYRKYAWYFPYVNERLRAIKARHPEMALADWATAARKPGVTYDAIHLNPRGAELMVEVVKVAMGVDARSSDLPAPVNVANVAASPPSETVPVSAAKPQPVKQEPPRVEEAQVVVPRKKPSYRGQRQSMFALAKIDFSPVVMLGDSLTERAQWSEITGCGLVVNRGIGGDDSAGVLRRLDDVIRLKPAAVFLMIGVNDVLSSVPTDKVVDNVRQTVERLAGAGARVYLTLTLPVSHRFARTNAKVDELNVAYRTLATQLNVTLVDFRAKARTGDGYLRDELSLDGVHLTPAGYRVWRDAVTPLIKAHCRTEPTSDVTANTAKPNASEMTEVGADLTTASIPPARSAAARGTWIIQLGAYPEEEKAKERIREAQNLGGTVLVNASPFTEKVIKGQQELYRARFAGFNQNGAKAACSYFKQNAIDCITVRN
jgi:lysophospholipase L1-like esterase